MESHAASPACPAPPAERASCVQGPSTPRRVSAPPSFSWPSDDTPPCGRTHCVHHQLWGLRVASTSGRPRSRAGFYARSCVLRPLFTRHLCRPSDATTNHYPGRGEGRVPRYFWSHLPFFPDQRQQMKNKTGRPSPLQASVPGRVFCSRVGCLPWKTARKNSGHQRTRQRLVPQPARLVGSRHSAARPRGSVCALVRGRGWPEAHVSYTWPLWHLLGKRR